MAAHLRLIGGDELARKVEELVDEYGWLAVVTELARLDGVNVDQAAPAPVPGSAPGG